MIPGPTSDARGGGAVSPTVVQRIGQDPGLEPDLVAAEEPLEIRVAAGGRSAALTTTMRTPGHDDELAIGWLAAEGIVADRRDVADIAWCIRDTHDDPAAQHRNVVTVTLRASCLPPLDHLDRRGVSTSACGVCGRTTIADLEASGLAPVPAGEPTTFEALRDALESLDEGQTRFRQTGGMHAAARASRRGGGILDLREDVGRHNALDKLVGAALLDDRPFGDDLVLLSGRASYELLQKAAAARIGVVAAVGAPSSLAIDVAERFDITLVGFLRSDRANVYTHAHRILSSSAGRSTAVASSGART